MAYRCNLSIHDLEIMTIGMVIDFVEEFLEQTTPQKKKPRKASQADFDSF